MSIKYLIFLIIPTLLACQKKRPLESLITKEIIVEGLGKQVDSLLTPYVKQLRKTTDNNAGLAIGITKGDKIIYARTFGFSNIEKSIEADINTVFHIASVSKPFIAAAIAKLIQQGKLKLDDKIIDYIPEFIMKDSNYNQITIKQILTHTSGIPRHVSIEDWNNPVYGPHALEKNLIHAKEFDLDFKPGSQFRYSNSAIDILGIVVSRASGMSFDEYVTKNILLPAGMTQSFYLKPKGSLPDTWALPYSYGLGTQEWSPYPYTENYFPSSGIQTSLIDMCNWGMLHTGEGNLKGKEILDKEHFDLLVTPYFDTPWGDKIGLSWFLQSYMDRPIIMHTGNDSGFESMMYIYPNEDISIIVMANRDYGRTGRIINAASEVLFDQKIKDYEVSAIYKFSERYKSDGIEAAKLYWEELKKDTMDSFYINNDDLLTVGAVLEVNKNWKEAKEVLSFYLTINNKSTYAWRLLGNSNLNMGDTLTAKSCYEQTLKINPDYEKGKIALEKILLE